jgi:hypothetical protein
MCGFRGGNAVGNSARHAEQKACAADLYLVAMLQFMAKNPLVVDDCPIDTVSVVEHKRTVLRDHLSVVSRDSKHI